MTERKTFTDLGVEASLVDALTEQGIIHPFPIQELTLPLALDGADLIGQARTGTGKTLAFGLPLLQRIDTTQQTTQALVVVPTRELCLQVCEDLTVGSNRGVTVQSVYGGVGFDEQIEALRSGVHVVVGTPGRTLDHLNRGNLDLTHVQTVVLDEADEMLDMGFLPDVERLLTGVPEERQTMLFSATMPTAIVKLARRFMTHPTFMRAEAEERETAPTVEQHFFLVHRMDKPRVLARILQTDQRGGAFVFTRTKNMADRLVRELEDLGVEAIAVHGDLRQSTREKNLDRFRAGKADVLVATEVAARGLDVTNVTHVINYDCPDDEKMYLHRIGRTARAGAKGVAVTFAEFNEVDRLNVIRKAVGAGSEIAEVFSTSDELTTRFDLPAETPWEHLARTTPTTRRKGSTDGRPKSQRSSEGPSARRPRRERPSREQPKPDDTQTSDEKPSSPPRTRTRVRTRERAEPDPTERKSTSDDPTAGGKDSGQKPPRARARAKSSGTSSSPSKTPSRTESPESAKRAPSRSKSTSDRGHRTASKATEKAKDKPADKSARPTRRGEEARGAGAPRPRRRVQVQHLP